MSWKADRSTARGVVCQSGGARICTQVLNSLIRSVLVWIPPEADLRQGFYLDSTGNMSWEHGEERGGRAAHKECVTKPATPVNIWSSTPPGNLGAREEDTSEGLRPQDKRAGVLRRALSHQFRHAAREAKWAGKPGKNHAWEKHWWSEEQTACTEVGQARGWGRHRRICCLLVQQVLSPSCGQALSWMQGCRGACLTRSKLC